MTQVCEAQSAQGLGRKLPKDADGLLTWSNDMEASLVTCFRFFKSQYFKFGHCFYM